jgi:putative membrane protein
MMWGYGFSAPGAGMMAWMVISSLVWLVIVGIAVWALVRWLNIRGPVSPTPPNSTGSPGPSALEILRQRYARGELDEATFQRMQAQLAPPATDEPRELMAANGRHLG